MTTDLSVEVSDRELMSLIKLIHQDTTYSGVSMICGSLRARGVKVTRDRVHLLLRSANPLSSALRWPASEIRRRPYSVPGPNPLWHIGML